MRRRTRRPLRRVPALILVIISGLGGRAAWGEEPPAQAARPAIRALGLVQAGRGRAGAATTGVFLPTNRLAVRRLELAKQLISEDRFDEAVRILGAILDGAEDSFIKPAAVGKREVPASSSYPSLKSEASRMLAKLPARGRNSYELQFGATAKKRLTEATEAGNAVLLAEVARRFFHTQAGYEATLLLAAYHSDHRRPLSAALAYQQLLDAPLAVQRLDPALSVLAAASWVRAGMPERAKKVLDALAQRSPGAQLQMADQTRNLDPSGVVAWLDENLLKKGPSGPALDDAWAMYRGNGSRNATSSGGIPLMSPRWRALILYDPALERLVADRWRSYVRQGVAALPSLHPLAIGNVVLMRTPQQLLAVDFKTGKLIWNVEAARHNAFEGVPNQRGGVSQASAELRLTLGLEQRLWDDATYGTISSDGERVYVIQGLPLATHTLNRHLPFGRPIGAQRWQGLEVHNRLTTLDLRTQGKLVWEVGGPDGQVDELADAFFLGPPLPLGGELHVLAEIKGGIQLVVLDAKTGELRWSQQLVDLERNILQDPFRRLAGATPSFTDGVLICPTSAGAVVAVDLTTRSLLWAYQYPQTLNERGNRRAFVWNGRQPHYVRQDNRWSDSCATVVEGRVLLTPVESNKIYCLNLLDGKPLWQLDRGENLYLACVHQEKVVLVGKKSVMAVRLADGREAWRQVKMPLPEGSLPSGRGFLSGDHYYLPVTSAEVFKIDLERGRIVEPAKSRSGHIPGNLICHRGNVISQGIDFLESYYQLDTLREHVTKALAENPDDADAMARLGEIELNAGGIADAIANFRRSWELQENELTRELLVQSMLEGLRVDFAAHRASLDELETLIDQADQRITLVQLVAAGLHQSGATMPAFEQYLKLIDLVWNEDPAEDATLSSGEHLTVRRDRWIQANLLRLRSAASTEERQQIDAAVQERIDALGDEAGPARLQSFLAYFGAQPQADVVRERLAAKLLGTDAILQCEALLLRLARSDNEQRRAAAVARLARLLRDAGQHEHAAACYRRLAEEFGEVTCLEGKTGHEISAALPADSPVRKLLAGPPPWPSGEVFTTIGSRKTDRSFRRRMHLLDLEGDRGTFFRDMSLAIDPRNFAIVGHDRYGRQKLHVPLKAAARPQRSFRFDSRLSYGKVHGHVLVLSLGHQILAVDASQTGSANEDGILWRANLIEALPRVAHGGGARPHQIRRPGGGFRTRGRDRRGNPIGRIGPVTSQSVTFQRYDQLAAVDPLTGEQQWIRHNMPPAAEIFGDEEVLLVVPQNSSEAILIHPLDGSILGRRRIPKEERRWATLGRNVLHVDNNDADKLTLTLYDPWEERDLWSRSFAAGAKIYQIEDDEMGVLERSGKFVLFSLQDGAPRVEEQLTPDPMLSEIFIFRSVRQYLLISNQATSQRHDGRRVTAALNDQRNVLITGNVYAFDRTSGAPQWSTPASLEQQGLLMSQPSELPALAFVQHVAAKDKNGRKRRHTAVRFLDKQSGRPIYENKDLQFQTESLVLFGDPKKKIMKMVLPRREITLAFTDYPVPPEPPAQADATPPRASGGKGLFGILRDIPKAISGGTREAEIIFEVGEE